jgi:prepilin-type N-terminal cleavage/methylation domain-containing protein
MRRLGFTMIELVFVIVVMGIIGKFGVEFLAQAYKSFIFSNVNHNLQSNSEMTVNTVAARLQYRIKDSVIKRRSDNNDFLAIGSDIGGVDPREYNILEWVGTDIEGFRGDTLPYWSGIIDLDNPSSSATSLVSPETNTTAVNNLIQVLRPTGSTTTFNNAAIYFIGSNSDINNYGWDSVTPAIGSRVMHPITTGANLNRLDGNLTDVDVYEYYQLAWTAYGVGIADWNATGNETGTLTLWYDYQPWEGETYLDAEANATIMENVSTFQFKSVGSVIKIQVCTKSDLVEEYSICKEKTVF